MFGNIIFRGNALYSAFVESSSIFRAIIRSTLGCFFRAIFVLIIIELTYHLILANIESVLYVLSVSDILSRFVLSLSQIKLSSTAYISFLSTLIQIAGIFLGLYFTAVSVVASTIYARVPADVRSLLIWDKVGNIYIKIVAFLGATAILLLTANICGYETGILSLLLVMFLGIVSVLSFVKLGIRVFYFFDPTKLVGYLSTDLLQSIKSSTPKGFRWWDRSFQDSYRRKAEHELRTYHNLLNFAIPEKHVPGDTIRKLTSDLLNIVQLYSAEKSSIPSESYWFERVSKHRDWSTANYLETNTALLTGTTLRPEFSSDLMWFERRVEKILLNAMQNLIDRKDVSNLVSICVKLQSTINILAKCSAIEEAFYFLHMLKSDVLTQAYLSDVDLDIYNTDSDATFQEEDLNLLLLQLSLVDLFGIGLINILLGFSESLQLNTSESLRDSIQGVKWDRNNSIYKTGLPRNVIYQLEYLKKCLDFERDVEGRIVSPLWYQQQIAADGFVRFIAKSLDSLSNELESTFVDLSKVLISKRKYIIAAQLIQRGLEACNKFTFHLDEIESRCDHYNDLRKVGDIPWTNINWEEINKKVAYVREQLVISLAESSPILAKLPRSTRLPDYFGHAYIVLSQECYNAMATGNEELFKKIIPHFFKIVWPPFSDKMMPQSAVHDVKTSFIFETESIMDILEISGLSIIYSELYDKNYWDTIKTLWDDRCVQSAKPLEFSKSLIDVYKVHRSSFMIDVRGWEQDLRDQLKKSGLFNERYSYSHLRGEDVVPQHPSAIIRAFTMNGEYSLEDPKTVFLAVYALDSLEIDKIELPQEVKSFYDSLCEERLSEKAPENKNEN